MSTSQNHLEGIKGPLSFQFDLVTKLAAFPTLTDYCYHSYQAQIQVSNSIPSLGAHQKGLLSEDILVQ